jgi:hypothetical protein
VLGEKAFKPFSVSARDGLAAKQTGDAEALQQSGLPDFEAELVQFLTRERTRLFLAAMCDRALDQVRSLPEPHAENLFSSFRALQQQINPESSSEAAEGLNHAASAQTRAATAGSMGIGTCEVCKAVMDEQMRFLGRYQYDLSTRPATQEEHAKKGGFCSLHTWHYEQIASPRGVCTAYPALLNRTADRLRSLATNGAPHSNFHSPLLDSHCPACRVRWATEDQVIVSILSRAGRIKDSAKLILSPLCLPHLQLILQHTEDEPLRRFLLSREAALIERIAEDMQRYAIKYDALRRDLASREENEAYLQALQLLVGHRNVNAVFTVRDIL